jgi:hypothetical protein
MYMYKFSYFRMKKELEFSLYATARSSCVGCDHITGNDRLFCIAYFGTASRAADADCLGKGSDADDATYVYRGTFSYPYHASYANSDPHDGAYTHSHSYDGAHSDPFSHGNAFPCRYSFPYDDPFPHTHAYREQ